MIIINKSNSNAKQAVLPILISDYLDICDPVLTFDRFMEEMDLEKYLREIPKHDTGRPGYNPASMLKTVLFGFMANGYISLRELEDSCKVNLRFMYLIWLCRTKKIVYSIYIFLACNGHGFVWHLFLDPACSAALRV